MSELALFIVRLGFVAVLWIFVFSIISVIRADLFGQKVVSRVAAANAPEVISAPVGNSATMAPTSPAAMATRSAGNKNGNAAGKRSTHRVCQREAA